MKQPLLERLYAGVIMVILAGIVIHAPLSVWLGVNFPRYSLLIKSWKEILMLLLVPLVVIIATRRRLWSELARDWLLRLCIIYGALHLLLASFSSNGLATAAGLAIDLRYIVFFVLVYALVKIQPSYRLRLLITWLLGAMMVIGFGFLQIFLPADILAHIGYSTQTIAPYLTVDKNPNYIRINSTLRGPNPVGAYAVIVLAMMTALATRVPERLRSHRRQIGFAMMAIASLVVLWVSYSRSALVAAIVAVGLVLVLTIGRKLSRRSWIVGAVVVCGLAGGLLAAKGSSFISNVILHENPNGGSSVSSNDGHVASLLHGLAQLVHQPLGAGIGSTGSASLYGSSPTIVENQYLFVAHEAGWLGLLLFIVLSILLLVRLWQRRQDWVSLGVFASGIGLLFIGLLLPVWADDTIAIIWWGLAAIALASEREE
jgi:hypothetical protein